QDRADDGDRRDRVGQRHERCVEEAGYAADDVETDERREHQHEQSVDEIELHKAQMLPQSPFVALQHRNFRLLWSGLLISFSGSNMQTAALLWHVSLLVPAERRPLAP